MICERRSKNMFYTLTLSAITVLLFTGCGGSDSSGSSGSPENKLTGTPISGVLKKSDGATVDGATVNLDLAAKAAYISSDVTKGGGEYLLKTPKGASGKYLLVIDKEGFLTQYQDVTIGKSVPTILMKVGATPTSVNVDEALPASSDTTKPKVTFDESVKASVTLLEGAEIPSKLPEESGQTLLPVGALALQILPSSQTKLDSDAAVSVPLPSDFSGSSSTFLVYFLKSGKWEKQSTPTTVNSNGNVEFNIRDAGTYMVMTKLDTSVTTASSSTAPTFVTLGQKIEKPVTNTISFGTASGTVSPKMKNLIEKMLEKKYGALFGQQQIATVIAPKQSSAKIAGKFVCNTILTTQTITFTFTIFGITIPVTIIISVPSVSCGDDGSTGGIGGIGGI